MTGNGSLLTSDLIYKAVFFFFGGLLSGLSLNWALIYLAASRGLIKRGESIMFGKLPDAVLLSLLSGALSILSIIAGKDLLFSALSAVFSIVMLGVAVMDMRFFIIPDELVIAVLLLSVVGALFDPPSAVSRMLGMFLGGGALFLLSFVFTKLLKSESVGGGDIKLCAASGAFLGWKLSVAGLLFAGLLALPAVLVIIIRAKKGGLVHVPFGFYLAVSYVLCLYAYLFIFGWAYI